MGISHIYIYISVCYLETSPATGGDGARPELHVEQINVGLEFLSCRTLGMTSVVLNPYIPKVYNTRSKDPYSKPH